MRRLFFAMALVGLARGAVAQSLMVAPGVRLPEDPVVRIGLMGCLEGWLKMKNGPDSLNTYVAEEDRPTTAVLMGQMRNLDRRVRGADTSYYRCYLGNVSSLDSLHWVIQLNYMGLQEGQPLLRACCTVMARREGDRYYISSPLPQNTAEWKSSKIGCCTFHYRKPINLRKAAELEKMVVAFDRRLNAPSPVVDFYCCDNFVEATKLVGIDYKADYNGYGYDDLSEEYGRHMVWVCGNEWKDDFCTYSAHDLWHDRLHQVIPVRIINRPVDEGMAYLYGGSWIIYSWNDVLKGIEDYAASHPGADWLALYKDGTDFMPPPKDLNIAYAINALIVQRLERDKGFGAAISLLCCGPRQKGDANYFDALKKVCGVDEAGFDQYVAVLLKDAR